MPSKKKTKAVYNSSGGYDAYAHNYDKKASFLDTFDNGEFMRMRGDLDGKKILNLGCGTGRDTQKLINNGSLIIGMDISLEMLKIHKKKFPNIEVVSGSCEDIPFEDESFDIVLMSFLIVHLKYLDKTFNEVCRVLKPGGFLLLNNINQRKAPKLDIGNREFIVIKSFYHRPQNVIKSLKEAFFEIVDEKILYEGKTRINQIVKAKK